MKNKNYIQTSLKNNGLKNTKHRAAILDVSEKSGQPIAVEQIFGKLKSKNISIDLVRRDGLNECKKGQ